MRLRGDNSSPKTAGSIARDGGWQSIEHDFDSVNSPERDISAFKIDAEGTLFYSVIAAKFRPKSNSPKRAFGRRDGAVSAADVGVDAPGSSFVYTSNQLPYSRRRRLGSMPRNIRIIIDCLCIESSHTSDRVRATNTRCRHAYTDGPIREHVYSSPCVRSARQRLDYRYAKYQ